MVYQSSCFLANCSCGGLSPLLVHLWPECLGCEGEPPKLGANQRVLDQEDLQDISSCAGQEWQLEERKHRIKIKILTDRRFLKQILI